MKNSNFKSFFKYSWVVLLAVSLFTTSCKDDDDVVDEETTIVEDGVYIKGAGTAFTALNVDALMKKAINEVGQAERATMYEMYLPVKAGADGFQIVMVEGGAEKIYGPGSDFEVVATPGDNEPTGAAFSRGTLEESSNVFTVAVDGFYHVVLDTEYNKIIVAKAEWGVIGAAVPSGWTGSTPLKPVAFDLEAMTFKVENMAFTKGDFKFRYSEGWKIEIDVTDDLEDNHVKVNTNLGGSLDALVAGGDNIPNNAPGIYTIELAWTKSAGYTATATKTGDLDMTDYSAHEIGLVGDGVMVDGAAHDWSATIRTHVPTLSGTVYTWTWAATTVTTAGSFKLRQGQTWDDLVYGYSQDDMAGSAADDFEGNGDGNFVPKVDGTYNFTLTIDAATETYTFTAEAAK